MNEKMNEMRKEEMRNRTNRIVIIVTILVIAAIVSLVLIMNVKNTREMQGILEESVQSQLISISIAAREVLDIDRFDAYGSEADVEADRQAYDQTLAQLRQLADSVGAEYIYALKKVGDDYVFVFDTDTEDEAIFIPYELSPVHEEAFAGRDAADILNVEDEYGEFNTGAVPIYKDDRIIGIMSADLQDTFIRQSMEASSRNMAILVITMALAIVIVVALVAYLLNRVGRMQNRLRHLAHHDQITGLPNRQYLMEFLDTITTQQSQAPFALLFIDLDNFKMVNDSVGHEAGDELLRHIASYLESSNGNVKSFRPTAGRLNIAARIGGDEFVQIVADISTEEEAAACAQRLLDGFTSSTIDRFIEKYGVGLSIGVALYPYHTDSYHTLIKYADIAMYYAKRAGKNSFRVFKDEMGRDWDPTQAYNDL